MLKCCGENDINMTMRKFLKQSTYPIEVHPSSGPLFILAHLESHLLI